MDGNREYAEIRITPPFDGPAPVLIMLNGPAEVVVEVGIVLRFELLAARERDESILLQTLEEIFEAAAEGKFRCPSALTQVAGAGALGRVLVTPTAECRPMSSGTQP